MRTYAPIYDDEDFAQDVAVIRLEHPRRNWATRKIKQLKRRRAHERLKWTTISLDVPRREGLRPLGETLIRPVLPGKTRHPIGRPRTLVLRVFRCHVCNDAIWDRYDIRRACSPSCARILAHRARQILPTNGEVERLYSENWSTVQLARRYGVSDPNVVRKHLFKHGVVLRKRTRQLHCLVVGCPAPLFKIRHAINGAWYGRRCLRHWRKHRAHLTSSYRTASA